eukprot:1144853-Pelagomonas_calceolata.AAC.4
MDPRFAGVALVALGRLGWTADTQLVDELLNRAKARMPEAYMRDLARIAHVSGTRLLWAVRTG